jgi:hypothetical protein
MVQGSWFRVQGSGFRVQGSGYIIDPFRYFVFPPRNFGLEMTFATRHAHRAPRHALGPAASCTGYTLSYPQAVRGTLPLPSRDERAIARSLDVWRDLRGGTHGFGPRLGRGASILRSFCRGAV